jgi:7,8-dihydropterin-6-yl-methyl-4-(beta-D-ribofuranosyl)aminobenzene 5'-phosphate synthase
MRRRQGPIEQSLVILTSEGPVVVTGCAHPGVVEIAERAAELAGRPPLLVVGGFHLLEARERGLREIARRLQEIGVRYAGACHCSGDRTREIFADEFGRRAVDVHVGTTIEVGKLVS